MASEHEEALVRLRQDAVNAWNDYQATGLHVTMEEADAWLACLASGVDADPPECHV